MKSYAFGIAVGALLALATAAFSLYPLFNPDLGYGVIALVFLVPAVCGPLLLLNIGFSLAYARRHRGRPEMARAQRWMWLPFLAAASILPVAVLVDELRKEHIRTANPGISETHVNLTRRMLMVDVANGINPGDAKSEMRYPPPSGQTATPETPVYDGARLSPEFRRMAIRFGDVPEGGAPTLLPVVRSSPDVGISALLSALGLRGRPSDEAEVRKYVYYYYADRVEVALAVGLSGSQAIDLWGKRVPLYEVHVVNLWPRPIGRLEIDGQAVALNGGIWPPDGTAGQCMHRNYVAYAIGSLDAPLRVRWQFATGNPAWHEAEVNVPAFRAATPARGVPRLVNVDLYLQSDGSVVAERSQMLGLSQDQLGMRATGPSRPLNAPPPCGTATARYTDTVVRLGG